MTALLKLINEEQKINEEKTLHINLPTVAMSSILSEDKKIELSKKGIETFLLDARDNRSFLNALNSLSNDYILGRVILLTVKKSKLDKEISIQ